MLDAYLEFVDHWTILLTADPTQDPSFGSVPLMHASLSSRSSPENRTCCYAQFSHHGFGNAVFTGNSTIVVDCLGFCNDFQLEVEVIRVTASAWHINDWTRSWSWTLTVYDANVSVSFATEFQIRWVYRTKSDHWIFITVSTFVHRSMFPKQEGSNKCVCVVCLSLQVWTFSFCFYVYH